MIKVIFPQFIASVISLIIGLIFLHWLFYTLSRGEKRTDHLFSSYYLCPYCSFFFASHRAQDEECLKCPRCKSLMHKDQQKKVLLKG